MKILLDGKEWAAAPGQTILDVARCRGIAIPTLCHPETAGARHTPSCLVCLVKVGGRHVPACATKVEDGMVIESETEEVRTLRRAALELLLSDHVGDCFAPCRLACPAGLDIPDMLRAIRRGDPEAAIRTIKETIPLPAVLGRVCPKPCEKICRRKEIDGPVGICALKRHAADFDLGRTSPYLPPVAPESGRRVLIVGAGPSGLSAAFFTARLGHRVALYAQGKKPGGRLRALDARELPEAVLDAEIRTVLALPIDYYSEERLDWTRPGMSAEIRSSFDAVLLCTGPADPEALSGSDFETRDGRLRVDPKTFSTSIPGIFAAGTLARTATPMIVRSVADGRDAAESIDRFLRDGSPDAAEKPPILAARGVKLGKLSREELHAFAEANRNEIDEIPDNPSEAEIAAREASRCLHCDCRGRQKCRLFRYAAEYRAELHRFQETGRREFTIRRSGSILFEPGKCIKCGLCIDATKPFEGIVAGLTFLGRGFDVRIATPFGEPLREALGQAAAEAVRVCPTAALSLDKSRNGAQRNDGRTV